MDVKSYFAWRAWAEFSYCVFHVYTLQTKSHENHLFEIAKNVLQYTFRVHKRSRLVINFRIKITQYHGNQMMPGKVKPKSLSFDVDNLPPMAYFEPINGCRKWVNSPSIKLHAPRFYVVSRKGHNFQGLSQNRFVNLNNVWTLKWRKIYGCPKAKSTNMKAKGRGMLSEQWFGMIVSSSPGFVLLLTGLQNFWTDSESLEISLNGFK